MTKKGEEKEWKTKQRGRRRRKKTLSLSLSVAWSMLVGVQKKGKFAPLSKLFNSSGETAKKSQRCAPTTNQPVKRCIIEHSLEIGGAKRGRRCPRRIKKVQDGQGRSCEKEKCWLSGRSAISPVGFELFRGLAFYPAAFSRSRRLHRRNRGILRARIE